ncbi:MAG: FecR domain-containing protein [Planctomycetota bacterium]
MTKPPDIPQHIQDQLALYFDDQATPEVVETIQQWLEEDPANPRLFAQYGNIERMIYNAQKTEDATAVFALLGEEQGPILDAPSMPPIEWSRRRQSHPHNHTLGVIGYIGVQVLRRYAGKLAGVAAVLVLAVVVVFVYRGMGDDPVEPEVVIADPPAVSDDPPVDPGVDGPDQIPAPPAPPIVASITAEQDTAWIGQPGPDLYAGQGLTLTRGFAEITTAGGAVAVLQAPATIEFIESDNALYLHTGKLVGICETESAKGFVVRTRESEITDLGTRFGVDASTPGVTLVQVFEGEVAALSTNAGAGVSPTLLAAGSCSQVTSASGLVEPITYSDALFASLLGRVAQMVDGYELSGDIERVSRFPENGFGIDQAESDRAQLYRVASGVMAEQAVQLHLGKPGMFVSPPADTSRAIRSVLLAGTRFDLYLVHFDPPGNQNSLVGQLRIDFEITFDRPIYGVFADSTFPVETSVSLDRYQDDLLGAEGPGLLTFGDNDRLVLSRNRRVLNGTLNAMICDRFWVLVTHEPSHETD